MNDTLVSCLMVTANRAIHAQHAIVCFEKQTHANCELVIIDDGDEDYSGLVEASPARDRIRYHRIVRDSRLTLGDLRNMAIEAADGEWLIQWDDDDWYHPRRIEVQLATAIRLDAGASALKWTLVDVRGSEGENLRFRADAGIATPGTILFRRGSFRYPSLAKNEDGVFLRTVRKDCKLAVLGADHSYLFVRVHHGSNTWDLEHFISKLRRTPARFASYLFARHLRNDVRSMKVFRLRRSEVETFETMDAQALSCASFARASTS